MKYLTLLLLSTAFLFSAWKPHRDPVNTQFPPYPCDSTNRKQLIIIGMVHSGNKVLNEDSLTQILSRLKPDLILDEIGVNHSFRYRIGKILGFARESVETQAITRYEKKYGTKIASYDLNFDRKKYVKETPIMAEKMWALINLFYKENKLSPQQKIFIDDYNRSRDYVWKYIMDSTVAKFNQKNVN